MLFFANMTATALYDFIRWLVSRYLRVTLCDRFFRAKKMADKNMSPNDIGSEEGKI